jgi:hypothetical protein
MVVAKSLARGVPVIASKGTPWSDLETHRCGLWVDTGSGVSRGGDQPDSRDTLARDGRARSTLDARAIFLGCQFPNVPALLWMRAFATYLA